MKKILTRLLPLILAAIFCLCSCGEIGNIANAVVSSVGGEISSAIADGASDFSEGIEDFKEGMNDLKEGLNDLKEGLSEASDSLGNAGSIISENIGSITDKIADDISSGLSEAANSIVSGTSASSRDTTKTPDETRQYTFRTQKLFDDHYKKHGAEFGDITQEEYLRLANELINSTSDTVLHKHTPRDDSDGSYDDKFFDTKTGHFLVLSDDGYIRTFFIPSAGINYWNKQ